jgi:predicted extracellular nuclease
MNKIRTQIPHLTAGLVVLTLMLSLVLSLDLPVHAAPMEQSGPNVFINEIHYDNTSTDVGEAIEIAGPAGTDLSGWTVALYNGSATQLNVYDTIVLTGVVPDQQDGFGTLSFERAGIQNGSPDGLALIDPAENVVQFLSYEGTFTAASGPAAGMTSTDIGVAEGSSTPVGQSLQLAGTGTGYEDFTWNAAAPNTFGAINTGQTFEGSSRPPFVNELHYDNVGTDSGEGIEVAGPAGMDLTGWSIVLYNGNGGAPYDTIDLSGSITDQQNGYGTLWFARAGIQNGSPDGFALVDASNAVLQLLSYEGTFTAVGGPADGMTSTDIGVAEGSSTPVDDSLQLAGTGRGYEDFTWRTPAANTYGRVNNDQTFGEIVNAPVVVSCDGTLYVDQGFGADRTVTASDADGTVVDLWISSISPGTDAITLGNLQPAPGVGGEASAVVTVAPDIDALDFTVEVMAFNDDDPQQSGACTFDVVVNPFLTIGAVQGVVSEDDDGTRVRSPYEGETVVVQGVIFQKILQKSGDNSYYGFHMQNTLATADDNPFTSDGIFVFQWIYPDVLIAGGGSYLPQVGDEIVLRGQVTEFYNLTQLSSTRLIRVERSGVLLDTELPAFETDPPDELEDANRYWERREGMRAQVPSGSIVLNGRDVFASSADSEVWVARGDSTIALREDPYARRSFRDAHPLDDIPDALFDNGNGYRIVMGGLGVKATAEDNTVLLTPARTYDTISNAPVGGVYYSFGKYQIQVEQQPILAPGVDPSLNAPPEALDRGQEYSIVTFNVENLYDYYDDPFDGCDFHTDAGCPGVYPPFDYVPPSNEVYQARLHEIAQQIVNDLHSPDIILTQEAEDQDVCTVTDGVHSCTDTNNVDGRPDTMQELATIIYSLGGPIYDAAYDRDGADDRGIISAYLYRTDRVELLSAKADDPVLGSSPQVVYPTDGLPYNTDVQNPKVLNANLPEDALPGADGDYVFTRAPQVALFRVWRDGIGTSVFTDLYTVDNHFSSGPDGRVNQRTEQANYNAAIVDAIQGAYPDMRVTVGGDLNVYPRPDDPFPPPYTSDQLAALYNQGMINLFDILVTELPVSAFAYIYQGQSQTLDQMFITPPARAELAQTRSAHINSDWPADYPDDGPRGTSDHDPLVASYTLLPTLDRLAALVQYYDAAGAITGNNTTRILLDRIERASRFKDEGKQQAYESQLWAFIDQIYDKTPRFITQEAADALAQETEMLLMLH